MCQLILKLQKLNRIDKIITGFAVLETLVNLSVVLRATLLEKKVALIKSKES